MKTAGGKTRLLVAPTIAILITLFVWSFTAIIGKRDAAASVLRVPSRIDENGNRLRAKGTLANCSDFPFSFRAPPAQICTVPNSIYIGLRDPHTLHCAASSRHFSICRAAAGNYSCAGDLLPLKHFIMEDKYEGIEYEICCERMSCDFGVNEASDAAITVVTNAFAKFENIYHTFAMLYLPLFFIKNTLGKQQVAIEQSLPKFEEWKFGQYLSLFGKVDRAERVATHVFGLNDDLYMDNFLPWNRSAEDILFRNFKQYFLNSLNISEKVVGQKCCALLERRPHGRQILNFEEVEELFLRHGYSSEVMISTDMPSLRTQIESVRKADIVFAAHGAFQTLGAFVSDSAYIIELQPFNFSSTNPWHVNAYSNWAAKFNYSLTVVESLPIDEHIEEGRRRRIIAPIEKLDEILSNFTNKLQCHKADMNLM